MESIVDFLFNIDQQDRIIYVVNHFDEIMLLYRLIGYIDNFSIIESEKRNIKFEIIMNSSEDADKLKKILNNTDTSIYNIIYSIIVVSQDNIINVSLTRSIV